MSKHIHTHTHTHHHERFYFISFLAKLTSTIFANPTSIFFIFLFSPPVNLASREVANLPKQKNLLPLFLQVFILLLFGGYQLQFSDLRMQSMLMNSIVYYLPSTFAGRPSYHSFNVQSCTLEQFFFVGQPPQAESMKR